MKTRTEYVSEFEHFMNRFLEEHPDVREDQRIARLIHWDRKVDLWALKLAEQDRVPEDGYGFRPTPHPGSTGSKAGPPGKAI